MSENLPTEYIVEYNPCHNLTLFRVEALRATNKDIIWGDGVYPQYRCRFIPIAGSAPSNERKWLFGIGGKPTIQETFETQVLEMIAIEIDSVYDPSMTVALCQPEMDFGGMRSLLALIDTYYRTAGLP